jgi:L-asparaginase
MSRRPTIVLIATGGTIAGAAPSATDTTGYAAGALHADTLLAAVPALGEVAHIRAEQPFSLDSRDLGPAHWLAIARRVRSVLDEPQVAGVVITHGTDTLEETACFVDATLASRKPVVMTGAMRPATALSTDGPMNLYHALCVAVHPDSAARGVLVVFGESILAADGVRKAHTRRLEAFAAGHGGCVGQTAPLRFFAPPPVRAAPLALPDAADRLPRVDVLWVGAGSPPAALEQAVASGARGIVLALPGNGSVPAAWREAVARAVAGGVPVVRATRAGAGAVTPVADDAELGTLAAGDRAPAAVRVVMMIALAGGDGDGRALARRLAP